MYLFKIETLNQKTALTTGSWKFCKYNPLHQLSNMLYKDMSEILQNNPDNYLILLDGNAMPEVNYRDVSKTPS